MSIRVLSRNDACPRGVAVPAIAAVTFLILALATPGFSQTPLPDLKSTRWQTLNASVAIDPAGKAWFVMNDYYYGSGQIFCPDQPDKKFPFAASDTGSHRGRGMASFWIDSQGRAWGNYGTTLTCVGLAKGEGVGRSVETKGLDLNTSQRVYFVRAHLESSTGRVYMADTMGLHVFDGKNWSYQRIREADTMTRIPSGDDVLGYRFVQCPGGQVFFWGRPPFTQGYYIHDGSQWTHQDAMESPAGQGESATAILPLNGRKAVAIFRNAPHKFFDLPAMKRPKLPAPPTMEIAAMIFRLNDNDADKRRKAQDDLSNAARCDDEKALATAKMVTDAKLQAAAVELIKKAVAAVDVIGPVAAKDVDLRLQGASLLCQGKGGEFILRGGLSEGFRLVVVFPDGRHEVAPENLPQLLEFDYYGNSVHQDAACPFGDKIVINTYPATLWDGKKFSLLDLDLIYQSRIVGKDDRGRIYIAQSNGSGLTDVFDASQAPDLPALKYRRFAACSGGNSAFMDSKGQVWARLSPREHPFLSRFKGGKWVDAEDPPMFDGSSRPAVDKDIFQYSGVWCGSAKMQVMLAGGGYYSETKRLPSLSNVSFIQLLKDGVLALDQQSGGLGAAQCLCLHDKWTAYPNARTLVEKNYKELLKAIDNTKVNVLSNYYNCALHADACGRIWLFTYGAPEVYDGSKWTHSMIREHAQECWFSPNGKKLLTPTVVYDLTTWPPKVLLQAQPRRAYPPAYGPDGTPLEESGATMMRFLGFRRSGRILALGNQGGLFAAGDDLKFVKMSVRNWSNGNVSGERMFQEDSSGRLWFNNWITIAIDGAEPFIKRMDRNLRFDYGTPLVEQDPQTFWVSTNQGLMRIRLSGKETLQSEEKLYAPAFPPNCIQNMFIDKEGTMWIVSQSGLFRIELPPVDK